MKQYQVNTMDVCVQGFERLRSNSEFILVTQITAEVTFEVLKAELLAEISAVDHGDEFDYPAAMRDVGAWLDDNIKPLFEDGNPRYPNPFNLDATPEDDDGENPVNFFLYVQETVNETEPVE